MKTRIGLSFSQDDLERLRALQEVLSTRNRSETVSVAVQMALALRSDPVGSLAAAGVHFETPVSIEIRKDPHQVVVRCPQTRSACEWPKDKKEQGARTMNICAWQTKGNMHFTLESNVASGRTYINLETREIVAGDETFYNPEIFRACLENAADWWAAYTVAGKPALPGVMEHTGWNGSEAEFVRWAWAQVPYPFGAPGRCREWQRA